MKLKITYNRSIALLLLVIYLLGNFKVIVPYLAYQANYDYASKVLCENRLRAIPICNGQCFLQKQIKQASDEDTKSKSVLSSIDVKEFVTEEFSFASPLFSLSKEKFKCTYLDFYCSVKPGMEDPPPELRLFI